MKIWLDTEFNGWGGDLISMALVPEYGEEFYEVLKCEHPSNWVLEHVMHNLNKPSISLESFKQKLAQYINQWPEVHIVATWPTDYIHFMDMFLLGDGMKIKHPNVVMEMPMPNKTAAQIMMQCTTHNALDDARALKIAHP